MRDEFPAKVIRRLFERTSGRCSNPNCPKSTSGPQPSNEIGVINIGVAAHITAAAPGGKRYDSTLSAAQRRSISNGIWLCQDCAKLIDSDAFTYSVPVLCGWKECAERRAFEAMTGNPENPVAVLERRLSGHKNFVWDIVVTPNGRKIISASNDSTVRIWDTESGVLLRTLEGHTAFVCSLSLNHDGSLAATGATDGRIIVWNINEGTAVFELQHRSGDAKVSWAPTGEVLISGGVDGEICGWSVDTRRIVACLSAHREPILKLACLRDGRVISVSSDRTVRVCDLFEGRCLQVIEGHSGDVNSVAISPDEKYLVTGSGDKTLRIWELASGSCRVLYGHEEVVWRVSISPDGKLLASGSGDDTVRLWSLESGRCLQTLKHPDCIAAVAFSPIDQRMVVGCDDANIYVYSIRGAEAGRTERTPWAQARRA